MRDRLTAAIRRITGIFTSFTSGQKAVTILGVVILAVGGYFFAHWAATPSYSPLFANLSTTDASAIVDKLSSSGAQYKLSDGGTTILVPQNQVYDLRLKMSGQGLPAQADTGYSLLDKQGITTSEFMQNVTYQRALEGELDKTIKSINGVQDATVHLAMPQQDVFSDDSQKPTASVLVTSALGHKLSDDQVQSIVHLVASSVVGLDPKQVTVAGSDGTVLSTGDGQVAGSGDGDRDNQTGEYEQRLNTALEQMLSSVVGAGHVVVHTTADLDYDQTQTKTQTYVAPGASTPPLSQSSNVETYSGTGSTASGVLGADNIQVPSGTGGAGNYTHSTNTQDNPVGMVTETRNSAPGNTRKLSVAVLLDSTTAKNVNLTQIESLVASAVALTPARGDTIAISSMPFSSTAALQAKAATTAADKAGQQAQIMSLAKTAGAALLVLILVFLAWRAARRSRRAALSAEEITNLERIQATIESQGQVGAGSQGALGRDDTRALGAGSAMTQTDEERKREISSLVQRQPEQVAELLRGWMAESKKG